MLYEFACHPYAGNILIFSVSFQLFLVYVLPQRALKVIVLYTRGTTILLKGNFFILMRDPFLFIFT